MAPPLCVVGAGPSIHDSVTELRRLKEEGCHVCAVNHAHDWLVGQGITPDYCFLPESYHIYVIQAAVPGCTYLLRHDAAEHVKKSVAEGKVELFNQSQSTRYTQRGLGSVNVFYGKGYRKFHMFGFDACIYGTTTHFDGKHERAFNNERLFVVDGRIFHSNKIWKHQALALMELMCGPLKDEVEITFYGDGLLAAIHKVISEGREFPPDNAGKPGFFLKHGIEAKVCRQGDRFSVSTRHATLAETEKYVNSKKESSI